MDEDMAQYIQDIAEAARQDPEQVAQRIEAAIQDTEISFGILMYALYAFEIGTNRVETEKLLGKLLSQRTMEAMQFLRKLCERENEPNSAICLLLGKILRHTEGATQQAALQIVRQHRPEALEFALSVGQGVRH